MTHVQGTTGVIQWYLGCGETCLARSLILTGTRATLTILGDGGPSDASRAIWNGEDRSQVFANTWGVPESSDDFLCAIRGEIDHRALLQEDLLTLAVADAASRSAALGRITAPGAPCATLPRAE